MKVHEFGTGHAETFAMFPCTAEPWRAFRKSAEAVAEQYHVFLFMPDGHDELGTDFVSVEKTAEDAARWLRENGVRRLDAAYGVSMGGACVLRLLAAQDIPVGKAVIDAGITPYPYPKWICRLIALRDFLFMFPAVKSFRLMKLLAPPERWTPEGEDPAAQAPEERTQRRGKDAGGCRGSGIRPRLPGRAPGGRHRGRRSSSPRGCRTCRRRRPWKCAGYALRRGCRIRCRCARGRLP